MRERLLQWLACPACGNNLTLENGYSEGEEIIKGTLNCPCGQTFPVIGGVPRMLCGDLSSEKKATMERFGYEWLHFSGYNADNFKRFIAPLPPDFFKGKLGLDVGCGAGRHAGQAGNLGAEIVAIDLSQAVDTAQSHNADNARVHVVQADIYKLPLKPDTFDFIYSLGVLHHFPDPEGGYRSLVKFLKKGGALFVWVYARAPRKVALELLRFLSQRLSNKNILRMAYLCNLVDFGIFINLYKAARKLPCIGRLVDRYVPLRVKEYATHGFRTAYADWFDRLSAPITNYYKEHEMLNWLRNSGLCNTRLEMEGDSWWWLYGEREA